MEEQLKIDFEKLLETSNFSKKNVEIKRKNFENFIEKGFPNRREENWKFSDINQIISKNIKNLCFYNDLSKPNKIDQSIFIDGLEHNKLVFVNGRIEKIEFDYEEKNKIEILDDLVLEKSNNSNNSFLIITHYQRLLDYIKPDFLHVLMEGKIIKSGGPELALELEKKGYENFN